MRIVYTIGIWFYRQGVRLAALFNSRARTLNDGWREWRQQVGKGFSQSEKVVWFHASSLGEFEQARPLIETFKQTHPTYKVCLSFFSPSGYNIRKNYDKADIVCYLPPDTPRNVAHFLETINPDIAFFVKYDFWFNYLHQLKDRQIPTYIFSTIFRPTQYFFRWYGRWFAHQLDCYTHLFVQNETSSTLLHSIGINRVTRAGDTRFDRVNAIATQAQNNPLVEAFIDKAKTTIIVGSSWEPEEEMMSQYLQKHQNQCKVILAPHMIDESHLCHIEQCFAPMKSIRLSTLKGSSAELTNLQQTSVMIIDSIGLLSTLYQYADIAMVGGGFGKGIHNTLEAIAFHAPVAFGPNHKKFQEARDLIQNGGAQTFSTQAELDAILDQWMEQPDLRQAAAEACSRYRKENIGATAIIMKQVEESLEQNDRKDH